MNKITILTIQSTKIPDNAPAPKNDPVPWADTGPFLRKREPCDAPRSGLIPVHIQGVGVGMLGTADSLADMMRQIVDAYGVPE